MTLATTEDRVNHKWSLVLLNGADRDRVNQFVTSASHGHFRQLYDWSQVLTYDGTRTLHLGIESAGSLRASFAMRLCRIPGTPWTFLTGLRGPVMDLRAEGMLALLVKGIKILARSHRSVFLRIDPDYANEEADIREILPRHGFIHVRRDWSSLCDPRIVMRVDLRPPESELLAKMRKKHRQHIHGTSNRDLRIRSAREPADVERFIDILTAHCREKGIPVRDRAYFHALWGVIVRGGFGELFLVEHNGEICAGGLAVICGPKSWFLYTAMQPSARALFPGEPIYWEVMRWAKARGAEMCDFGGTGTAWPPAPDSPAYSLYFFKQGFNAHAVYLTGYYDLVFRPRLYRLVRFAEDHLLEGGPTVFNLLRGRI